MSNEGHVFVTWNDLTTLACDAWLLPTDAAHTMERSWLAPVKDKPWPVRSEAWMQRRERSCPMPDWDATKAPWPWVTNVGATAKEPVHWFVEGALEFVRKASEALSGESRFLGRERPLLALPFVGTRHGGAEMKAGGIVDRLLKDLEAETRHSSHPSDVALVAYSAPAFAAAQAMRRKLGTAWDALDPCIKEQGNELAQTALRNQLVLFIGAGVSKAAKGPSWGELLNKLADAAGLSTAEREDFNRLGALDQATVVERRTMPDKGLSVKQTLGARIKDLVDLKRPSLAHTLLAALPVKQAVTTNYDRLFEIACEGLKDPISVLPHAPDADAKRWILKLHGCVTRVEDIVLTREDYLRYEQQRAALAGIVQALLITHQLLFVGFSLTDDNFHRIADAVRRALDPYSTNVKAANKFGTALTLDRSPLRQELWGHDLAWISMADPGSKPQDEVEQQKQTARLARRQEIFLDYVLAHATTASNHLLKSGFEGVLDDEQSALREKLLSLAEIRPSPNDAAWCKVRDLWVELGHAPVK